MKDYKKILEGVIDIINNTEKSDIGFANICSYIGENCPELKESKDERILKIIKETLKSYNSGIISGSLSARDYADCLAWLEKQSKNVTNNIRTTGYWNVQDIEQSPVWSEKDTEMYYAIISDIQVVQKQDNNELNQIVYERELNWLKSLKDRIKGD